jgi:pimeloyl-ACP methyl ester carboxylesterase
MDYLETNGRRLAYRHRTGRAPTILFLPGYASDMEGSKASALDTWAAATGQAMLRFDYGGCGASEGAFEAQTLAGWRDDALAMIDRVAQGPVVLVGSSMGGWIMLLVAMARPARVAGLVGIAAAPDFTGWGFTQDQKLAIMREGRLVQPGPEGEMVTSRAFWESGESLRLLHAEIAVDAPVRLLQGQQDDAVPWTWSLELMKQLRSPDVALTLIKDGDHRLSRDGDIALLVRTVEALAGPLF